MKRNHCFFLLHFLVIESQAQQVYFAPDVVKALLPEGQTVDLSYFEQGLMVLPGSYTVDVYVNRQLTKRQTLNFKVHNGSLVPVFNVSLLAQLGVNVAKIKEFENLDEESDIFPLVHYLLGSVSTFDGPNMRLDLTIPQIYMKSSQREGGIVSPELWDDGVTAALVNYSLTGSHHDARQGVNSTNQYLNLWLDGQFNFGAWRLLSTGTLSYSRNKTNFDNIQNHQWNWCNTYLQRDLPGLKSQMKIGEINTVGDLFDSISMRGISIGTYEQMLPYEDRTFMPTISGYANSFAQVFVKQNDRIVYQMQVSPGPWRLDQLPNLGNGGDLTVVVREADGTERVEVVPYTAVPLMLREGQFRYDFNLGKCYRNGGWSLANVDPWFTQFTFSYGLPCSTTLLGGAMLSQDYQAYAVGAALSMGNLGAVSFDWICSEVATGVLKDKKSTSGSSYRIRYEKSLSSLGTRVNLASYRYLTKDFYSFGDLFSEDAQAFSAYQMKYRWQFNLSQTLGKWGNLSANANYVTCYDSERNNKTWGISYSKNTKGVGTRLTYSRMYRRSQHEWHPDERWMFYLDLPFSLFTKDRTSPLQNMRASYQLSVDDKAGRGNDVGHRISLRYQELVSPWYGEVSQTMGDETIKESALMLGFNGDRISTSLAYTQTKQAHTYQLSANGGLLLHSGGITASSRSYDSVVLVQVPGVEGARINKIGHTVTDSQGNVVVNMLRNYCANEIALDPSSLPEGALLTSGTNQVVYPGSKAIVRVIFPVRLGHQAMIYLTNVDGTPLPFGTLVVLDEKEGGEVMSFVGEGGRTYFSGLPMEGILVVKSQTNHQDVTHRFKYRLPINEVRKGEEFVQIPELRCTPRGSNFFCEALP